MDAEYLEELRDMMADAIEGLDLTSAERATLYSMTDETFDLQENDLEILVDIIAKAKNTPLPPRMMEEYEITHALHIGDKEVLFGVAEKPTPEHGNCPYLVAVCNYKNPLNAPWPEKMTAYTGYVEAVDAYHTRIQGQLEALKAERAERGDNTPLGYEHCIPGSECGDYTDKVVVFHSNYLRPEYQYADHQLYLAQNGNGCNPDIGGRAIFATNLYSGEQTRINRPDVLGVIRPDSMPEWARAKLAEIQAGRAAKARADAPDKPKKKQAPGRDGR